MAVYDLEVVRTQLPKIRAYAEQHGIQIIDVFVHPDLKSVYRVRFNFPRGTYAAFQREFDCFMITHLA